MLRDYRPMFKSMNFKKSSRDNKFVRTYSLHIEKKSQHKGEHWVSFHNVLILEVVGGCTVLDLSFELR